MGYEMIVDRIEKNGRWYILTGESGEKNVTARVLRSGGTKEGDIVEINGNTARVLKEKTRLRREKVIALQKELFG